MKKLLFQLCLLCTFFCICSFKTDSNNLIWNQVYNQNGIKISYDIYDCKGIPMLFWKIENSTGHDKIIKVRGLITEGNMSQQVNFSIVAIPLAIEGKCDEMIVPASTPCLKLIQPFLNPKIALTVN